jgi:hypothetical protein
MYPVALAVFLVSAILPVRAQYVACTLTCPDGIKYISAGGICRDSSDACYNSFIGVVTPACQLASTPVYFVFSNNADCLNYLNTFMATANQITGPASTTSVAEKTVQVQNGTCACTDIFATIIDTIINVNFPSVPATATGVCTAIIGQLTDRLSDTICAEKVVSKIPVVGSLVGSFCGTLFDELSAPIQGVLISFCAATIDIVLSAREYNTISNFFSTIKTASDAIISGISEAACGPIVCAGILSGTCGTNSVSS